MDSMFLTNSEIVGLTNKRRRDAQATALNAMGIIHKIRPDGTIAILREHVRQAMGGSVNTEGNKRRIEPNWEGINSDHACAASRNRRRLE